MNQSKSLILNPFALNVRSKSFLFSLLTHLIIFAVFFSTPEIARQSPSPMIHVTLLHEAESAGGTAKDAAFQQLARAAIPNYRRVGVRHTDINFRQSAPEDNNQQPVEETKSNAFRTAGESIQTKKVPEKSVGGNPPVSPPLDSIAGKASEASLPQSIVESRFGDIGAPSFIYQEIPVYPELARRLGKEGRVILKLLIDADGKLLNVEVIEATGYGFTEASVAAVKKSRYSPGYRDGVKVATRALLPVSFRLQ